MNKRIARKVLKRSWKYEDKQSVKAFRVLGGLLPDSMALRILSPLTKRDAEIKVRNDLNQNLVKLIQNNININIPDKIFGKVRDE